MLKGKVCYVFPLRSAFWYKWYRGVTLGLVGILETAMDLKKHLYLKVSSPDGTWCHAWCLVVRVAHHCEIWCILRIGTIDIWINLTHLAEQLHLWNLKSGNLQILLEIRLQLLLGCRYDKNRQLLQACYVDAAIMAVLSELDQISPMSRCLTLWSHIISIFRFLSSIPDSSRAASQDILFPQKTL